MKNLIILLTALTVLPLSAFSEIRVVTSTADLAYFAREIGGEHIEVESIASPKSDIHFIEVRPSHMMKVNRADIVLKVGMELDMWIDRIIDGSRNSDLEIVDCSEYVEPLEVPGFKPDARHGDLHRYGNPHYWIGPQTVPAVTRAVVEGLSRVAPHLADTFAVNQERFLEKLQNGLDRIQPKVERLKGVEVVFYHNSWPYFNKYVGLEAAGFVEPYPGVPPSPSHVKELTEMIKGRSIKIIAIEPYFDDRVPNKIASGTDATVIRLYPSVGGRNPKADYLEWFEGNLDALLGARQ